MAVELLQVEARSVREEVVDFLWDRKHWPWRTREEYYRAWDWRYSSLSEGEPLVWIARDSESASMVGHIAVYPRRFRIAGTEVRVGVPGNLVVHHDHRTGFVGPRLVSIPRTLVKSGVFDMIVAFGNERAHPMFLKLGFQDLGRLYTFTDVRRCGPALRRRLKVPTPAGPLLDGALAARRGLRRWRRGAGARGLEVRPLSGAEFLRADRSHWAAPADRLVPAGSSGFVARRFIDNPITPLKLHGLVDRATGALEGYVVSEGNTRARVWECAVNHARLSEAMAISCVADAIPALEAVQVPLLPNSQLARELRDLGFLQRKTPADYIEQTTSVGVFWLPTHPLAAAFADTARWNLWFGSNHY
jgi:hypothetical protein